MCYFPQAEEAGKRNRPAVLLTEVVVVRAAHSSGTRPLRHWGAHVCSLPRRFSTNCLPSGRKLVGFLGAFNTRVSLSLSSGALPLKCHRVGPSWKLWGRRACPQPLPRHSVPQPSMASLGWWTSCALLPRGSDLSPFSVSHPKSRVISF